MPRIKGKVAIITGAAGGIGSAAARRFIEEGAQVVLVDRDQDALKKVAGEFPQEKCSTFVADVANEDDVRGFVSHTIERFGKVDIALLNAGTGGKVGSISDTSVEEYDRIMAVNVRSVWLGLAALMPNMRKSGGGSIIITSSVAGLRGSPHVPAYSASKHAVLGLMRSTAIDGAPSNIRVNAICPAQTHTPLMEAIDSRRLADNPDVNLTAGIPIGRYAEPAEVASLMLFLASDDASYCTGGAYMVDGARTS